MTIDFKLAEHDLKPGVTIVEILLNGKVCGVIYPEGENGIKIISAHFSGKIEGKEGPIPVMKIGFRPRKYIIQNGKIKYLE